MIPKKSKVKIAIKTVLFILGMRRNVGRVRCGSIFFADRYVNMQRVDQTRSWVEKGQTTWQSLCPDMVVEACHGIYNYSSVCRLIPW